MNTCIECNLFVIQADDETFNRARVVVGPENPAWGSTPYTLQPGLCGTEADYIHLTTQYLSQQALGIGNVVYTR